ncbi:MULTISPECIES: hypothetical protein [Clostridium]|uniref:Uncharacterized protein n=1 Tax=Clostridium beijerinckii TaxID=1520 RepID=A0A1S9N5V6_CLOBE|nr:MULTISPECIES: hypothetical protein [Clostridium]EKQ54878.1 MAG: hypothetical protein A370_03032 [Clostridium sp. Maddingley MBC34-26]MZK53972.1 hypothetical protein [Clostridium beijerinckii]MZK62064.1 hypothetical protein [Clostridium beijerinckii]MZK72281.1 hypothetical protein [Clostridium beijerinckii]MZK77676.1 hypothetical protein [Clostridium beijerinckii]
MKKLICIISFLLSTSLIINTSNAVAQQKQYSQGIYSVRDLNLSPNMSPKVENISQNATATIIIFDSNQLMHQAFRLKPQSQKYNLLPIDYDYTFVIIGSGKLIFS